MCLELLPTVPGGAWTLRKGSRKCGLTVPLAALGSRLARPEPQEYLGTSPAPPAAFGCARVEAARAEPALLTAVGPTRSWESRGKAQPLLPPTSAPTAQPQPPVSAAAWFPGPGSGARVAARPCSPWAGLAGARLALTSRPAAGTVQRGRPSGAGSRGGGA